MITLTAVYSTSSRALPAGESQLKFSSVIWAIPRDLISTESPPMANGATGTGAAAVTLAPAPGDTRARPGPLTGEAWLCRGPVMQ